LTITGVDALGGTEHRMLPDMIEVGSFIGLAAMTQSDITIKNAGIEHLGIIPERFQQLGIQMNFVAMIFIFLHRNFMRYKNIWMAGC
jgi:UDP-N-acetylglucosamine 1-carboxyvinyltransferase